MEDRIVMIRVLGALEVEVDGAIREVSASKERLLLTMLASQLGNHVPLDRIVDELWPDRARLPANASASVQVLVSRLRRHLAGETNRLVAHRGGYSLNLGESELDARVFLQACRTGRELLERGSPAEAAGVLRSGLELWRGHAYEGVASATTDSERARLEEARMGAWESLFNAELATGNHAAVLADLDRAIALNPFHERFWGLKMTALYRSGRQAEALRTYRALRKLTLDELGFEPTPELQRLEIALLEQSPSLDWAPGDGPAAEAVGRLELTRPPLQPRLTATATRPLVGRDAEVAVLRASCDPRGPRRVRAALVSGEPGAGKTRLVAHQALASYADGAIVLVGRCEESPAGVYQAIAEPVQWLLNHLDKKVLTAALPGMTLTKLQQLASPSSSGGVAPYSDPDPDQLFEAVAELFRLIAADDQVLLVIEDIHWLDAPTSRMLRYLTRRLESHPVVLICTHRSDRDEQSTAMHDFVTVLRRAAAVHDIAMTMLDLDAVSALAHTVLGRPVNAATASAILDETAGNPLFVVELLRHLIDTGALGPENDFNDADAVRTAAPPASIRELVDKRIGRLDRVAVDMLCLGATVGREFDAEFVAQCTGADQRVVAQALDLGEQAGLIEHYRDVPGRYTFNHAITWRTVYERISPAKRVALHGQVAEALERSGTATAPQLALHHYLGAAGGSVEKVLTTSVAAAHEAQHGFAVDDSVEILRRIVPLIDARGTTRDRVELRLHLADAHWWIGDVAACQDICADALNLLRGRNEHSGELFARAVLGRWRNNGAATQGFSVAEPNLELVDMIDEALAGLTEHPALRAALLGRLGIASYWSVPIERRQEIADSAVALARASGSETVLLDVLVDRQLTLWAPGAEPHRLERSVEILSLARRLGQTAREADARTFEAVDHLALGDVEAADAAIRRYLRVSSRLRQPFYRWHAHFLPALRALMEGRFDDAESLTASATDDGEGDLPGTEGAFALTGLQTLWLCYERGVLHEIAPILESVVDNFGEIPAMDAARTWVAAEAGNHEQASAMLDALFESDFDIARTDIAWLSAMCLLASAAATVGHVSASRRLIEILASYSGRNALVWVGFCAGPVDHYLGRLASVAGDHDAAIGYLDNALALASRMNATALHLRIRKDRCKLLIDRGAVDGPGLADELDEIAAHAARLGMAGVAGDASQLAAGL